jgi:hypothetical protein
MYWIYAIFFFVNGEKKKERQLTKLDFEGKGSHAEHDKMQKGLRLHISMKRGHTWYKLSFVSSQNFNQHIQRQNNL